MWCSGEFRLSHIAGTCAGSTEKSSSRRSLVSEMDEGREELTPFAPLQVSPRLRESSVSRDTHLDIVDPFKNLRTSADIESSGWTLQFKCKFIPRSLVNIRTVALLTTVRSINVHLILS